MRILCNDFGSIEKLWKIFVISEKILEIIGNFPQKLQKNSFF